MTTTLLILSTILLALAGLAIMTLTNRIENAEAIRVKYVIQINNLARKLEEAQEAQYKAAEQLNDFKHDAYIREQTLRNALEDAETVADDNEWLYNDANNDLHEACRELEKLQDEHKNTIEGYEYQTELQAREIAELNQVIENLQTEIGELYGELAKKGNRIAELKELLKKAVNHWNESTNQICELQDELSTVTEQRDHLMTDRIEAIAHMRAQNETIAKLELEAFYAAEADLTEAIEAAEEAPIHIDDKKGWVCIGNWERLIVYKHNVYQPYIQSGLGAKIERTKRSDLTAKAQERYNALKAALKSL